MTKFARLSDNAYVAVRTFFYNFEKGGKTSDASRTLFASIYAKSDNPNKKYLEILHDHIVDLNTYLKQDEINTLQSELSAVLYYCSNQPFRGPGYERVRSTYRSMIPYSIMDLVNGIIKPSGNGAGKGYLPYAGCCEFSFDHPEYAYFGFEREAETWAISQILLEKAGAHAKISRKENALKEDDLFNIIFSFPPIYSDQRQARGVIDDFINLATKHLEEQGELILLLPMSFCFASSGWFDFRKTIYERSNAFSISVISLPGQLLSGTSIPLCVVHLRKDGKGDVLLVNAHSDNFVIDGIQGARNIDSGAILNEISVNNSKYVWTGKWSDLNSDVNLTPSRYLVTQSLPSLETCFERVPLSDVIIPLNIYSSVPVEPTPVIGMAELSNNYLNADIKTPQKFIAPGQHVRSVRQPCLVAGFMGGTFKVGKFMSGIVSIRHELFPFVIKSEYKDRITEEFLLRCILSEQTRAQANALSTGLTISRISKKDFCSILIDIPLDIDKQRAIIKEDTRQSLSDADKLLLSSFEEIRKDIHMQTHAIGQTVSSIKNWWNILQRAREAANGTLNDSDTIGKIKKQTVSQVQDRLSASIAKLIAQTSRFDRGNGMVREDIDISRYLHDYISENRGSNYEVILYDETLDEHISFPLAALDLILQDILKNAEIHGFKGTSSYKNVVSFALAYSGENIVLTIANNGNPLSSELQPSDVFVYGKSASSSESNFGIGGYEIKHLMAQFGGQVEFIKNYSKEFPVAYRLTFKRSE